MNPARLSFLHNNKLWIYTTLASMLQEPSGTLKNPQESTRTVLKNLNRYSDPTIPSPDTNTLDLLALVPYSFNDTDSSGVHENAFE